MRHLILTFSAITLLASCGGSTKATRTPDVGAAPSSRWHEIRFDSAVIQSRRADGSPWHQSTGSRVGSFLGVLGALAFGVPISAGHIAGSTLDDKPEPLAPAPYLVLRVGAQELNILPVRRGYAPHWSQALALYDDDHAPDAQVVLQVMDDIDGGLIGQTTLRVRDLCEEGPRTLTDIGAVASLTLTVVAHEPREIVEVDVVVPGTATRDDAPSVEVWNGDRVEITATGRVCPSSWYRHLCVGPGGTRAELTSYNLRGAEAQPHAALLAWMREGVTLVGAEATVHARHSGRLYLRVNDSEPNNNQGAFEVHLRIVPGGSRFDAP